MKVNFQNGDGEWGIGDGGWGIGPNPQSPIPNPQSPIPRKLNYTYLIIKCYINNLISWILRIHQIIKVTQFN